MEIWLVGIINLLIGFALAFVPRWLDRRRRLLSYWKVLRAEIEYCRKGALAIEVVSPLGRLPRAIYDEVLKHVVAEGDIEPDEADKLARYYDLVQQVNDSLDIVAAAIEREGKDSERAKEEVRRTTLKRSRFAADHPERYYTAAIEVANRRCSRSLWRF